MNRDDIIRWARESGFEILIVDGVEEIGCGDGYHIQTDLIERFFRLAYAAGRKAEQELCAKIADAHASIEGIAQAIAAEIRSDK